jgi:hypothetical protein
MNHDPGIYEADYEYIVGGSLPADADSYVVRGADDVLYERLLVGKFCYVLNARQMGKSSLRVRVMKQLQAVGVQCASIDLTAMGSTANYKEVAAEEWYLGIVRAIVRAMGRSVPSLKQFEINEWWAGRNGLSFIQRWAEFIEDVLLVEVSDRIVIFIDEIDSVLGLTFEADVFFAAIRECYNRRADQPEYERLTFVLLGVSTPQDLVKDRRKTPFNVGGAIELTGFTQKEAIKLATGLPGGEKTMAEILKWTGGQPFLTQKLCNLVRESDDGSTVDSIVQESIIADWERKDEPVHLRAIQDRMVSDESIAMALLGLYQRVLVEGGVAVVDGNREQLALRLTGLVVKQSNCLVVANYIYENVFGTDWISEKLLDLRPYEYRLRKWLEDYDENWLLTGQALRHVRNWAGDPNRKLAPDDYRFLQASQDLERRFKFKSGSALNIYDLVQLCENYPKEAQTYLQNGYLEKWLVGSFGEPNLGAAANGVIKKYARDIGKATEIFIRSLYEYLNEDGDPMIVLTPSRLDLGQVTIGCREKIRIQVKNVNRGLVWGDVSFSTQTAGITIDEKSFDSRMSDVFIINIDLPNDINVVKSGNYLLTGNLNIEGIARQHSFQITYEVVPVNVEITPNSIELGVISRIGRVKRGEVLVKIKEGSNVKISGFAMSSNSSVLQVSPFTFKNSTSIEYWVSPRNSVAGPVSGEIIFLINGTKKSLPFDLIAGVDYVYVFLIHFPLSMLLSIFSGLVRHGIEQNIFYADTYSLMGVFLILGLSLALSAIGRYFRVTTRRNLSSKKGGVTTGDLSEVIQPSLFIGGIVFSWIGWRIGLLNQIGYISLIFIDFICKIFYAIGIESNAFRWAALSFILVNMFAFSKAWRKLNIKQNRSI